MCDINDFFLFLRVLGGVRQLPHPLCVGLETRDDPSYGQTGVSRQGPRHCIFQYTLEGRGLFRDATGTYTLEPGTAFLCESHNPAIAYGYPADGRKPWKFLFLDFSGRASNVMVQDLVRRFGPIYNIGPKPAVVERLLSLRVHDQIGCTISALEGMRLVSDLLQALLSSKEKELERQPEHQLVRQVHDYVQTNMAIHISVSDVASHLGISREHLTRMFSDHNGTSPYQYILSSKISAACSLLHAGVLSVKEISNKLGFDNVAHFTRAFKRIMRCTPSDYRSIGVLPANTRLNTLR